MRTREELHAAAERIMKGAAVEPAPTVDLLEDDPLDIELATTLLYEHCASFVSRQVRACVEGMAAKQRQEIIDLGTRHRGKHDELSRAFSAGQRFRFDILMDIGGFRDMHRHRRCVQIGQDFTFAHGYETPTEVSDAGIAERYSRAMNSVRSAAEQIACDSPNARTDANYLMPLGYRKRTLFKMDFAEALYISELRTGPGGPHVVSQGRLRDVPGRGEALSRARVALPRHGRQRTCRPSEKIISTDPTLRCSNPTQRRMGSPSITSWVGCSAQEAWCWYRSGSAYCRGSKYSESGSCPRRWWKNPFPSNYSATQVR